MRHFTQSLLFLALAGCSLSAKPGKTEPTAFQDLCNSTRSEELTVVTNSGETVRGYCVNVVGDKLRLSDSRKKVVEVSRATIARIRAEEAKRGNNLRRLGTTAHDGFAFGFSSLFSPAAPVGLVTVPAVAVYTVVAAPFCALGDLFGPEPKTRDIEIN